MNCVYWGGSALMPLLDLSLSSGRDPADSGSGALVDIYIKCQKGPKNIISVTLAITRICHHHRNDKLLYHHPNDARRRNLVWYLSVSHRTSHRFLLTWKYLLPPLHSPVRLQLLQQLISNDLRDDTLWGKKQQRVPPVHPSIYPSIHLPHEASQITSKLVQAVYALQVSLVYINTTS